MQYILIQTEAGSQVYQCIHEGVVVGYKALDGTPVEVIGGSGVVDANPPTPAWDTPDAPDAVAPTAGARRLTKLGYMNRFTDSELGAIYTLAKTEVAVEVWLAKFNAATPDADGTSVDLDDPRTVGGLQAFEYIGLLAAGRAAEILG